MEQAALEARMGARDLGSITREQHEGRPLAELAPWLFPVKDNLIVNKDAGVMACHEFDGVDADSTSHLALRGLARNLNKFLVHQQEEPLMFWWTVKRTRTEEYPVSEFPDPVSRRVDEALKRSFLAGKNYVNRHYLSTVLQASSGLMRFQERVSYAIQRGQSATKAISDAIKTLFDDQRIFPYTAAELQEACDRAERILMDLTGNLTDLKFRRLAGAELGGFLHGMVSPQASHQEKVALSALLVPSEDLEEEPDPLDCPAMLDESLPEGSVVPGRDFLHFSGFKQKFAIVVTVKDYPDSLELGALDRLYSIPGEMTITYAVRLVPKAQAEGHASKMRDYHEGGKFSWKAVAKAVVNKGDYSGAPANKGKETMAKNASAALGEFTLRRKSGLYAYMNIICYGDTLAEADETAEKVEAVLRGAHIVPEKEHMHLVSAFATSIPGMWKECARWRFLNSKAFSMVAPVHTISKGQTENAYFTEQTKRHSPALAVLPTDFGTPFYLSTHLGDLGHGFLAGPSRAGKSILGNLIAMLFRRYPGAQVIILDKDYSSRIPVLLQGGTYLDFDDTAGGKRFNPISWISEENLSQTLRWMELLFLQRGYEVGADDSKDLEASLRATMTLENPSLRRLSTVFSQLSRENLRRQLAAWVGDRVDAKYFDNEEDGFDLGAGGGLIGMEIGKLLQNDRLAIPAMEYCFNRIDAMLRAQRNQGIVRPTFVYVAEVWHLVRHEYYRNILNDWLKTLAKRCACVWMDTQSVEDFISSGIFASMRDNIPNRIFLPNRNAESESLRHVYRREFELTDSQVARIANGVQKRDYMIQQGPMFRTVQARLEPDVVACLRSDMAAQIVFDKHFGSGNPNWQETYIEEVKAL